MLMTSGQWDLNALEALEREALEVYNIVEVPERLRSPPTAPAPAHPTNVTIVQQTALGLSPDADALIPMSPPASPTLLPLPPSVQTLPHGTLPHHHSHHHSHHFHHNPQQQQQHQHPGKMTLLMSNTEMMDFELQDHIKHCACTCNHMGYGNFMDYQQQTSCFGGLPDVTEHSNSRRPLTASQPSPTSIHTDNPEIITSKSIPGGIAPTDTTTTTSVLHQCDSANVNVNLTRVKSQKKKKLKRDPSPCKVKKKIKIEKSVNDAHNNNGTNNKLGLFSIIVIFIVLIMLAVILMIWFFQHQEDRNSYEQRLLIVHRILKETPLIDARNNLPWNIKQFAHNRLDSINFTEHIEPWHRSPRSQTDLYQMRRGLIGAQFWSAYVPCAAQSLDAVQLALEQIDLIHRFCDQYHRETTLVRTSEEILLVHRTGHIASLIGVDGGHTIGASLSVLRAMYAVGVRYMTLANVCDTTWSGAAATATNKGLTLFGRSIIKEMNRLGMMIDLSHASVQTARDVLKETRAPIIYASSAASALCNITGNIDDELIRDVADNGGIIMISFYAMEIACEPYANIGTVIAHLNHIRMIAGVQHIGIGAGYDSFDNPPVGLENVSKYPDLFAKLLEDATWTEDDLSLLAGRNFLRVLKSVENVRDYMRNAKVTPFEMIEPPKYSPCTYMRS